MEFKNLLTEMAKLGITQKELAKLTGTLPAKLSKKFAGKIEFRLDELVKIRNVINPALKLEYLFYQELA